MFIEQLQLDTPSYKLRRQRSRMCNEWTRLL